MNDRNDAKKTIVEKDGILKIFPLKKIHRLNEQRMTPIRLNDGMTN